MKEKTNREMGWHVLCVRIPHDIYEWISKIAEIEDRSISKVVIRTLRAAAEAQKDQKR